MGRTGELSKDWFSWLTELTVRLASRHSRRIYFGSRPWYIVVNTCQHMSTHVIKLSGAHLDATTLAARAGGLCYPGASCSCQLKFLLDKVLRIRSASSGFTIFHRVFAPCPFPFLALPTPGTVGVVHAAAMFGSCFWWISPDWALEESCWSSLVMYSGNHGNRV